MFGWEFPPHNSGGLGTACQGLTKSLAANGIDITFVLPKKLDLNVDYMKMVFGNIKINYVNSLLKGYITSSEYKWKLSQEDNPGIYGNSLFEEVERYASVGAKIAKFEDFDVIHAHDWLTVKAGIAGNGNNKTVYDIEREGMHKADKVVAVSEYTKNKIVEHYGIRPEKVEVVHNGVEFESYTLNKAHKLKEKNKMVLFVGRITLQKGPDYFVHAAKRVLDVYPDAIFVVVGNGDMEHQMINMAASMGIADRVLFAGFLRGKEKEKAYQMADLLVMPSVSEPFGIVPLEALMYGTPVLISKQSGVSEVLTHSLKTDFWDVDEMANKIVNVLTYKSLYNTLRDNGMAEIKNMDWDKSAKKCIKVYKEIAR